MPNTAKRENESSHEVRVFVALTDTGKPITNEYFNPELRYALSEVESIASVPFYIHAFWSVYRRLPDQSAQCVADCPDQKTAWMVADMFDNRSRQDLRRLPGLGEMVRLSLRPWLAVGEDLYPIEPGEIRHHETFHSTISLDQYCAAENETFESASQWIAGWQVVAHNAASAERVIADCPEKGLALRILGAFPQEISRSSRHLDDTRYGAAERSPLPSVLPYLTACGDAWC